MRRTWIATLGFLAAAAAGATDFDRVRIVGAEAEFRAETLHPVPRVQPGAEAWRDVFTWPRASYIAVHFERFDLAPGEKVVVQSPGGKYSYTFEGEGKPGSGGTFWATHVPGDTCEVVYYGNGDRPGWGYSVDKFAHGFPAPEEDPSDYAPDTICGDDDGDWAKCYEFTEPVIYEKSRAIARLMINGIAACTGWLVGCEGHLMTNAHCITNPADALNTDYEFMAEGATCTTECRSFGACPGVIEASSGTLIQTGTQVVLDYSLVQLPAALSSEYGFFQLRPSGPVVGERIYLNGHPQAWGKRFNVLSSDPTDESGFCEVNTVTSPPAPGCSALGPDEAGYMCDTQSGSSGSPVVAFSDHRVVILHHCSGCENTGVLIQDVIADLGPNVPACATEQLNGTVEFDASSYGCSGTAGITVRDESLVGAGSQNVTLSSSTETSPETVTLSETPAGSGTFAGTIPLTTAAPTSGDGQLSVQGGDTITVVYIDADDGQGGLNVPRTDTAAVDCRAPVISNVAVTNVTGEGATISWTTDEPATSDVRYGLEPPLGSQQLATSLVTSHSIKLSGLTPCTQYLFSVRSQDAALNAAEDDNDGGFYSFMTRSHHTLARPSTDTPVAIPDNDPGGVASTRSVLDNVTVTDVDVEVNITHTYDGDIELYLITPAGTSILLSDQRGDDGDNYEQTVFDDEAEASIAAGLPPFTGSFRPEKPLGLADGINAAGDWKLKVVDLGPTDFGTIDDWTLLLSYAGACGVSAVHEDETPTDGCSGTGAGGANGNVEPGEDVVLPVTLRNDGTTALTGIVTTLSTGTPGVTVTRAAAGYPDLAIGATAASSPPHFAFTVGTEVACGSTIDFQLGGVANEGAFGDTFSLMVGTPGVETTSYASSEVPRPLPDLIAITSTVSVADPEVVRDVEVELSITHTWVEDLDIFLIGPNGTRVMLSTDNGGSGDNYTGTIFDDEAPTSITTAIAPFTGRFRPEQPLSALDGIPASGTWTLEITDDTPQDVGILQQWSLTLTTGPDIECDPCAVVAPVSEVENVRSVGTTSFEWDPVAGSGFYNVYRGEPEDLPFLLDSNLDSCRRMSVAASATGETVAELPGAGEFFWYLVRAANAGGEGPAGDATPGPRVHDSSGPCP